MTKYERYQDYVIKNGKLVGEFEQMYQDFIDPWEQTKREEHALEKIIGLELMRKYRHQRPLEYGCGFGGYTEKLRQVTGYGGGVDISETAIERAHHLYPECDFYVGDVLQEDILKQSNTDCICMIEISWYVLEKLAKFKQIMKNNMSGAGFFHTLMTYASGEQQYGKDFFTNLDEIKSFWGDAVDIREWGINGKQEYEGGDRTFIYGTIK